MLRLAIVFLVVALMAALFGFGLVANMSYDAAKILFFIFFGPGGFVFYHEFA